METEAKITEFKQRLRVVQPWQWALVAFGIVAIAALIVVMVNQRQRTEYAVLFSQLSPADAGAIVSLLEEQGIPFELAASGTQISVPATDVHRLRLQLAADGLPSGGVVGMEIMDRFQFGATEFERRMSYLRALQGELTRTIEQIQQVRSARVHIVIPEPSLFVSQRQPASAAVLLQLAPGGSLTPQQIQGIANLVAASVEDLEPDAVTIIDSHGTILSHQLDQSSYVAGQYLTQLDARQRLQSELQRSVQTLLEQVFGPGNVAVRVNADMNFDVTVIERELFEPADPDGLLRSIQELEEEYAGTNVPLDPLPGTDSNVPLPTFPALGGESEATYTRTESTRNYEVNRIRERIEVAPGVLERLSVSVVVNEPLDAQQIEAVRTTVANAIGVDPGRNDEISVIAMPFDTTLADELQRSLEAEREAAAEDRSGRLFWYVIAAAAALGLLITGVWLRRRAARAAAQSEQQRRLESELARRQIAASADEPDPIDDATRRDVERLIRQKPDDVVQLIRAWLARE